MRALSSHLRKQLETTILAARRAAEDASRATIEGLGVFLRDKPGHLDADQAALRNGLRAKWRQLGEHQELLVAECAYEQWHRLLFARFLAENNLLLHPQLKASVTLADCDELAAEVGEPDGWSVAARFAAEILPGIFPVDDPCFRLRLAPEGRHALEQIIDGLPDEVFVADDALGWVYQFWQKDKKDEVNNSERKIGGADLGPVTQLFTENYMVRFLLENSLGAWWAARHPESRLVAGFEYLTVGNGKPLAGSFEEWPNRVADITVMDPCCGSGHFLVEAFSMLWQMRVAEEGLTPIEAQDAVLSENLFGLELDARCVQIAMFSLAMQAWKAGGGWRELPIPHVACSGIPVRASSAEWKERADGDTRVEDGLDRLHALFTDADTLGTLVDPRRATVRSRLQGSFDDIDWEDLAPLLAAAARHEVDDPAGAVLGADAAALGHAADLLTRHYTLIATNLPYLSRGKQSELLRDHADRFFADAKTDLATTMLDRLRTLLAPGGTCAVVGPDKLLYLQAYKNLRQTLLASATWNSVASLGSGGFSTPMYDLGVMLITFSGGPPSDSHQIFAIDVSKHKGPSGKASALISALGTFLRQHEQLLNPDARVTLNVEDGERVTPLSDFARSWQGLVTGDVARFTVRFWEVPSPGAAWERFLTAPRATSPFVGRTTYLRWEGGAGALSSFPGAHNFNPKSALGKAGVLVAQMGELYATVYSGEMFNDKSVPLVPVEAADVGALWAYCSSPEFHAAVRRINQGVSVGNGYMVKVPFDAERWRGVAAREYSNGLPQPSSNDPTQWLFRGGIAEAQSLQVATARLLGYRWPEQMADETIDVLADSDGIVCLPAVAGESPATERLQRVLAVAFGDAWMPATATELLRQAGSKKKNLTDWLRDEFFKQHCALFGNRPFIWHIWDGQRDGFSVLVNYHRLDRKKLAKLTYTYLGQDWVERQRTATREEVSGAEVRLAAALELQNKLEAILEGDKPYDVYVRWKEQHEQPIGWEPDVDDGVRLNIRPFVEAGILRSPFNIHWKKDRGKNADGSERHNDIHLSLAEKREARARVGRT